MKHHQFIKFTYQHHRFVKFHLGHYFLKYYLNSSLKFHYKKRGLLEFLYLFNFDKVAILNLDNFFKSKYFF